MINPKKKVNYRISTPWHEDTSDLNMENPPQNEE